MEFKDYIDPAEQRRQFWRACLVWLVFWIIALYIAVSCNLMREWRLNNLYLQADAVILDKRLERAATDDYGEYEVKFFVRYRVLGANEPCQGWAYYQAYPQPRDHATAKGLFDHFSVGVEYPCWYDPDDPWKVALSRSYSTHAFHIVFACVIILVASLLWMWWQYTKQRKERLPDVR